MENTGMDFAEEIRRMVARIESNNPDVIASARIKRAWNLVADASARKHTDAVYVVPGTSAREVVVFVDSQIWAADLNLQTELLRLRLNLKLEELLEQEGRLPARDAAADDALFSYERTEHVKKLKFVPSKEKYTKRFAQEQAEKFAESRLESVQPVELDAAEEAELSAQVAVIDDPDLREAAYQAARKHRELQKGLEAQE